jgi:CO dehydrogenase maturation factor
VKIAVAGKGGVGKTFISATLARLFAQDGSKVLAIDADPNINLSYSLGISSEVAENIVPISENDELIEEKTGIASERSYGVIYNMTPTVDDVVERFGVEGPDGVKLLVMGTVKGGDIGCMCGANALLRVLMQHILIQRRDIVVLDMVAGLEHLGRGTARRMDLMLVVLEPRMKSVETLRRILKLAGEIEVKEVLAIGNKISNNDEKNFIEEKMDEAGVEVIAFLPYDTSVAEADMYGIPAIDHSPHAKAIEGLRGLKDNLKQRYNL